jgi:hypothetical protein
MEYPPTWKIKPTNIFMPQQTKQSVNLRFPQIRLVVRFAHQLAKFGDKFFNFFSFPSLIVSPSYIVVTNSVVCVGHPLARFLSFSSSGRSVDGSSAFSSTFLASFVVSRIL